MIFVNRPSQTAHLIGQIALTVMLGFAKLSMQAYNFAMGLTISTGNMTKSSKI